MCLAVPAKITELKEGDLAVAQVGESSTYITASTMLLPEPAQIGDYIIVHAGFALHRLDPEEASQSLAALRELAESAFGESANF